MLVWLPCRRVCISYNWFEYRFIVLYGYLTIRLITIEYVVCREDCVHRSVFNTRGNSSNIEYIKSSLIPRLLIKQ